MGKTSLKERNPMKFYRNAYYASQISEWLCVIAPIVSIFGIKWNEYFVVNNDKYKMTIGCVLAIVMGVVFAYRKLKYQEKQEKKSNMYGYALWVGVVCGFSFLFKSIIDDLFIISITEFIGAVGAVSIDTAFTQNNLKKYVMYKEACDKLDAELYAKREKEKHYPID